jgi:MarR family transcriptional regulator for hemolysin
MSKLNANAVKEALELDGLYEKGAMPRSVAVDVRGRTVPWMARTLYRLYDSQAQKVLELSKRVGIASTTAVPALDSMEKRNLVRRMRDPKDRRKYYVNLQDEGRRLVDELLPEITAMVSSSFEGIAPDDLHVFWKVMRQIENNLNQLSQGDSIVD